MTERPLSRPAGATRAGLALLIGGMVAIGVAYAATIALGAAPRWAEWCVVAGAAGTPVALFVLGSTTRGGLSRSMSLLLGALFVVLFASFATALAMPADEGPGGRLLLGLPLRLAIVLYGVGFVPLLVLPMAFAMTFRGTADSRS